MTQLIALLIGTFLAIAIAFHFYWGIGGQYGRNVAVPQREDETPLFEPTATATLAVAAVLCIVLVALIVYVMRINVLRPRGLLRSGMALLAVIFLARGLSWHAYIGLFKAVRTTAFARNDTRFYSPGCIATGLGFLFLAWEG
ncbi:MAG TPA: DUF3995 domain-containing protein [Chthoniobacterales bacterium]|nr:DUF3995 domain-containing protein [Chthoniobacterales bacterium]